MGIPGTGIYYTSTNSYAPTNSGALGDPPTKRLADTRPMTPDRDGSLVLGALFFALALAVIAYLALGEEAAFVVGGGCTLGSLVALPLYKTFGDNTGNGPGKFAP